MPEYSEAVEISRYGSQDVHTHPMKEDVKEKILPLPLQG
jgi:hypothetical protein